MLKVLVNGCLGRMGQEIVQLVQQDPNMELVCGVDQHNSQTASYPIYCNPNEVTEKIDVIIDFSVPVATLSLLDLAVRHHIPMVIATTGLTEEQMNSIQKAAKEVPIFQSANMSFDINLMAKLVAAIAPILNDTDIEIIETHHNRKIDSPSGTAIMLADKINESLGNTYHYEFNRHDKHTKREKKEIGFSSIRGGNIVGEHTVQFYGPNETFEIKHTSYSRTVFAEGAIKAAKFIVQQKTGMYHMDDLTK